MKTLISIILLTAGLVCAGEKPPCCREAAPATPLADKSLYQLESTWTSDVGKDVKLGVLRGRPQIVAMFFTTCEYACPIIVENMKSIEQALPENLRDKVDFLLVSFDVERDTVEALKAVFLRWDWERATFTNLVKPFVWPLTTQLLELVAVPANAAVPAAPPPPAPPAERPGA